MISLHMDKKDRLCMFDMGGVVAKHTDSSLERLLLRDFGVTDFDSFIALDPALRSLLDQHSKAAIDENEMWRQFSKITGISIPLHEDSLWGRYFKPELDLPVVEIIEELKKKGYRVVCATNTEKAHYDYHLASGQYEIFDTVYASLHLKEVKPDAAFFEKILLAERQKPGDVIFIDDASENCEAAALLGIEALLYTDPVELRWQLANMEML